MCITPLSKRNNYFGADPIDHCTHDTEHEFLNIPCGHCAECLAVRQSSYIQRVTMESKYNHLFFATLTYDNAHLPSIWLDVPCETPSAMETSPESETSPVTFLSLFNEDGTVRQDLLPQISSLAEDTLKAFEECTDDFGPAECGTNSEFLDEGFQGSTDLLQVTYADVHHLQLMFKRMRDNNTLGRNFRYIAVSERGSLRGRPHFHIIFFVPKQQGDDLATCETLSSLLKDMLLKYWSTNVGTRKNPVYERNFTYRERWIGRKLYRNFDCHYVNPVLTTDGVANVAYYVTKYIFKDSEKENTLKQLIYCKTADASEFHAVWDLVKSRCVCSKGLGLDATFETVFSETQVRKPLYEIAEDALRRDEQLRLLGIQEDLPGDDFELTPVEEFKYIPVRKRVMRVNPDITQELKKNALLEKEKGHAVFVKYNGEHVPLALYYTKRILDYGDMIDLYYSWDPVKYPDKHYDVEARALVDGYKVQRRKERIISQIDAHEELDCASEIENGRSIDPYDPYVNVSKMLNLDGIVRPKVFLGK